VRHPGTEKGVGTIHARRKLVLPPFSSKFDRNHNTAANPNIDANLSVAKQIIFHGGEQETVIHLPVIE
jgi:hypothetical protein